MITTHVLDLSSGKPAAGVRVALFRMADGHRLPVASGVTDADGRLKNLVPEATTLDAGVFELSFETGTYFRAKGVEAFHPRISVLIELPDGSQHYHVPVLVSPFGYTTYRGS